MPLRLASNKFATFVVFDSLVSRPEKSLQSQACDSEGHVFPISYLRVWRCKPSDANPAYMNQIIIRDAETRDLSALSEFSRRTFTETFIDGFKVPYPPEDLATFYQGSFGEAALAKRLAEPNCVFWIAERDGEILALCHLGPNGLPHPDAKDGEYELRRLYVSKNAQGLGLGTTLMKQALEWMQARTSGALWIGVWSGNEKAQKLYNAYGFEKVGEYQYPVGNWMDDEFILRRA